MDLLEARGLEARELRLRRQSLRVICTFSADGFTVNLEARELRFRRQSLGIICTFCLRLVSCVQ